MDRDPLEPIARPEPPPRSRLMAAVEEMRGAERDFRRVCADIGRVGLEVEDCDMANFIDRVIPDLTYHAARVRLARDVVVTEARNTAGGS